MILDSGLLFLGHPVYVTGIFVQTLLVAKVTWC